MSRRANKLQGQTSPYLLQHLFNPVDWNPWGPEALERARREDKPIFVSIGYAACHWCHVMERESFENDAIAAFLNERFVPIKVDREERPDLDEIYMAAVQMITGQGGWPLNVFLTPDLRPFYGGTYWPPESRYGRPGFSAVLDHIDRAWRERRKDVDGSAMELAQHIEALGVAAGTPAGRPVGRPEAMRAAAQLAARYDATWGGFGSAPKFPPHGAIGLFLREHGRSGEAPPREMALSTLDHMARGGIYDHVGGGFARYSVDERWLVPHFEKMLYDQALLVPAYADAWLVAKRPLHRRVVEQTLDFVRREMTHPDGGFSSSLDADSEGHEGKFYVWSPEEIDAVLGAEDGRLYREVFDVTAAGNFDGKNIPNLLGGAPDEALVPRLEVMNARLLEARARRVRPGIDDKVLTAWNGLMITAFARAYQVFGREEDLASARRAADFVLEHLSRGDRLLASWREGHAHLNAYLDDYAFFARGLVDLYEASFERRDLDAAARFARALVVHFGAPGGGFHFTSDDHETLLTRTRSLYDGALPAGSGVACELLLRLAIHLDDAVLRETAIETLVALRPVVERAPSAFAALLTGAAYAEPGVKEIVIAGDPADPDTRKLLATVRGVFLPVRVIALVRPGEDLSSVPLLRGRVPVDGRPAAYVCEHYACKAPVATTDALEALLRA